MHRWLLFSVAAAPLLLLSFRAAPPGLVWWTTHALEKVRPGDSPPSHPQKSVSISAARNEFEPFQIVFHAVSQNIDGVDVEIADLLGPKGAVIGRQNAAIYFEAALDLKTPSTIQDRTGEWPDPLIPRIDRYYGERRNAFPFKLSDGRNQAIWIEIYVPPSAPDGDYAGDVQVSFQGRRQFSIPVKLRVWNFTLPSTSSLPNSFGLNGISALHQHLGKYTSDRDAFAFTHLYQKAALWHRISAHGASMTPPPFTRHGDEVSIDWTRYDEEAGPFLDGKVFKDSEPLFGAKATSVDLRTNNSAGTDDLKVLYWREFARHFREKGWIDRLFFYVWDEPSAEETGDVLRKAKLAHEADRSIPNLVTASLNPRWADAIDIWAPLINCFEPRDGFPAYCRTLADRGEYETEIRKGKRLWWYQSCASHGCNTVGGDYFSGWPSYMIDASPVANRIMEWMSFKYGIQGELYFNMTEGFRKKTQPWENVNLFGGNGDGTLFYPGLPGRIGGKSDIPVESIRLKLIREGLEDYEYLHLLNNELAAGTVNSLVRKTYDFEHDPVKLYAARQKMGEALSSFLK